MGRHRAFTLIELLVVVSIVAVLASMAMPLVSIAKQNAKASATRSVMARVDSALHQFKADYLVYPYQRRYADVDAGEAPANRLWYHLGTNVGDQQRTFITQDMDTAAAQFYLPRRNGTPGPLAYLEADFAPPGNNHYLESLRDYDMAYPVNRIAAERARVSVLSGDVDGTGPLIHQNLGGTRDLRGTRIVASPASDTAVGPGWAMDYLAGDLEKTYRDGQQILDGWKHPLIYICQVKPQCRGAAVLSNGWWKVPSDLEDYGFNVPARKVLKTSLPADTDFLPDPSNLRHSDRRWYAAPGTEFEFELWSAGRDGRIGWMRDDQRNTDNIPLVDYDRSLR